MATSQTVEERVLKVFGTVFKKDESELAADTQLNQDLNARSMNMIELQAVLDTEFDIELPLHRVMRAQSIGDFIELVKEVM